MSTEAMEHVCSSANKLFPELNMRLSDLTHPTEAFLTRTFVHYLRAFGFRVEPPYNIESKDTSREKRQFLSKLCRLVERILQISFPGKPFTYIDIFEPTVRKTRNTLDVLFNYYCFYKMHKKKIVTPVVEKHKEHHTLTSTLGAKQKELGKNQQDAAQWKINKAKSEANIEQLREELPKALAELQAQSKLLEQKEAEAKLQEQQLQEITGQVNQLKQLVSDVPNVKEQTAQIAARIDCFKVEIAKQEEQHKERRMEIETNQLLNDEIDKLFTILPPEALSAYKKCLKEKEQLEKEHLSLETTNQGLLTNEQEQQQQLQQRENEVKQLKLNCEHEAQAAKQKIADQEAEIVQQAARVEQLEQSNNNLLEQLEAEQCTAEHVKSFVVKLDDKNIRDI
ncbi:bromodomain-containing protein DDB_G0280777 [Drosophila grimshawi]|uniref:GH11683 n=1 Tax=Drosophila grimshawi TaxID=7222 RepID=B4JCR3_DROGR|nr:bromodomain-containing protein DDB_G0280777 [Drosophila grimshawi]EDW04227.1 GH11683 [Drosophila grimshawi]